ncbi:MAG: hypothetical protein V3U60_16745 [Gammaproteobacteria bacterium]
MRVNFKKTTHFDITGLGGPYVDGTKGEEQDLPEKHALVLFSSGVVELLDSAETAIDDPISPDMTEQIAAAVRDLDPENDDHWTDAGLPAMKAVEDVVGTKAIKRADVEAAAPGWDRDRALEAATSPEDA